MGPATLVMSIMTLGFVGLGLFGLATRAWWWVVGSNGVAPQSWNPLLKDMATRPLDSVIIFAVGCAWGFLFAYMNLLSLCSQVRPVAIDEEGIGNFLLGKPLRSFHWSQIRKIVKIRWRHPFGFTVDLLRIHIRSARVQIPQEKGSEKRGSPATDALRGWMKWFPRYEIRIDSSMGQASFRAACDMLSYYATLHGIPMEFWDTTPTWTRHKTGSSPQGNRIWN